MVKFGKALLNEEIAEWQPYYMSYTKLKGFLEDMHSNTTDDDVDRFFEVSVSFFEELKINLKRVDQFYKSRERALHAMLQAAIKGGSDSDSMERRQTEGQSMCNHVDNLKQFAEMNHTGFRKITKKYDKMVGDFERRHRPAGEDFRPLQERVLELLSEFPFTNHRDRLDGLIEVMEAWRDKQTLMEPNMNVDLPRRDSIDSFDLVEPLMGFLPRRKKSRLRKCQKHIGAFLRNNCIMVAFLLVFTGLELYSYLTNSIPILKFTGYFTCWITIGALCLLVIQYPPDAVMVTATLILTICGIITETNAWKAFSSEVVLSVAGLGVIASCVGSTGIIDIVFSKIVGKPKTLWVAMIRLILPAVVLNLGVSNTCVMSCLLPVIDTWSAEIGHHKAFFLMPLSYVLLISGAFGIFSTSTNLVAQSLLQQVNTTSGGHDPGFGMFDLAVPVTVSTLSIIAYLVFLGPFFLKRFAKSEKPETAGGPKLGASTLRRGDNRFDVRAQINGRALVGQTLATSEILAKLQGGFGDVLLCDRFGEQLLIDDDEFQLQLSDVLILNTTVDSMKHLRNNCPGVSLIPQDCSEMKFGSDNVTRELVEVVLDRSCPVVGHRMRHARQYTKWPVSIVAFRGFNEAAYNPRDPPQERRLAHGDHLVIDCPPEFFEQWSDSSDFIFARRVLKGKSSSADDKPQYAAVLSGVILLCMVALVASSTLPLFEGVMSCLIALVITRCTTLEHVIKAVKLRTVLTIVGAFGLGQAIKAENVAKVLASALIHCFGWAGPRGILLAIFCATVALGVVFHGTAVVVLMFDIAKTAAENMNPPIPLHQVTALLCIAVTGQFLSPISYQTNLMAYNDGGYDFADFTKTGLGCVVCLAVTGIFMCEYWFPYPAGNTTASNTTYI